MRISRFGAAEVFIDLSEELKHTEANPIIRFTKAVVRNTNIRDQNSWKRLSLVMKQSSNISAQKSTSSQILCCALERSINIWNPTKLGRKGLKGSQLIKATENMTVSMESRQNSSGTSSQDSLRWQLCGEVNDLLSDLGQTPETFTGRILFMSMFNDISCDGKGNKEECLANARVVKVLAKKFGIGQWSFIGPGSDKKWYSVEENSPQGIWDHIADEMLLEFAESGCPIFRATTPLSRGNLKNKGHGKLSIHFTADYPTIETVLRIIVSANQLSLYGAVANMCEEFETHQDRSGQPDVLMGQSIVLSEIKAEVPLQNEIPSHQNVLLQQYEERIKLLSQENKVNKFCMDAGFVHVVEVGQYFMTKNTGDFSQFRAVARREYTLPRDDGLSQPRGWIQGNSRIGLVLEVRTSYLFSKYGIEI